MYCDYFGLSSRPFRLSPDPAYLYFSATHKTAFDHLEYGLREHSSFVLLTGEVGAGKTTLLKHVMGTLEDDVEVVLLMSTQVSPEEFVRLVLLDFELTPSGDKARDLETLASHLIELYAGGRRALLVVDEAQNLPWESMEEIRLLSNLQTEQEPLIQIILAGQPELRERLEKPDLRQLAQRITVSSHLRPLDRDETARYIAHRLRTAGATRGSIFEQEATARIHRESGGVPRLINNLCDACLLAAYADGLERVTPDVVSVVIRERKLSGAPSDSAKPDGAPAFVRLLGLVRHLFGTLMTLLRRKNH